MLEQHENISEERAHQKAGTSLKQLEPLAQAEKYRAKATRANRVGERLIGGEAAVARCWQEQ